MTTATASPSLANPLTLHLTIEAHRKRMVQLAGQYGLGDARVLRMSRRLDALILRAMKQSRTGEGQSVNGHQKEIRKS